nr:CapA family protein [Lachnospiraceae bacterium]
FKNTEDNEDNKDVIKEADNITKKPSVTPFPTKEATKEPEETEEPVPTEEPSVVHVVSFGDFLAHMPVINSGKNSDGTLSYEHVFTHVKDDIDNADVAVINMETIMGGADLGYSTFPRFNSPQEIGVTLCDMGFDVILHASNHVLDKGDKAVATTLDFWSNYTDRLSVIGIHSSEEDAKKITVVESNGIKIATLNYTYGLNGFSMDRDKQWRVDMLIDKTKIADDIERAKELADVVIVFPHWGTEYSHKVSSFQKDWTEFFAKHGVDVVVGAHPHVIEPVEWVESKVNGEDHKMLVYYSLGNFVSYQLEAARMLELEASFDIVRDEDGNVTIEDAKAIPLVCHFNSPVNKDNLTVYKLEEYTSQLASIHNVNKTQTQGPLTLDGLKQKCRDVLGDWYEE